MNGRSGWELLVYLRNEDDPRFRGDDMGSWRKWKKCERECACGEGRGVMFVL